MVAVSFAYLCFTPTERKSKGKCQKWFIVEAYKIYSLINPLYPQNVNNRLFCYKQNHECSLPQKIQTS